MTTKPRRYLAYMLRLWQAADEGEPAWRASLESSHTGERRGFAGLEALFAFLEEQTRSTKRPEKSPEVETPQV
jgi:hypothetical protein